MEMRLRLDDARRAHLDLEIIDGKLNVDRGGKRHARRDVLFPMTRIARGI